ncbi:MAG: response regulator [Cellvibrionaceae bacterium]
MNGRKALIVDDSRLAQFVLKKMLVDQDMLVDTSPSAEDALGYLDDHKPDIIFLDHTMPGMNGLEVLKVIKANPDTAPIPVMMYTSQEDSSYMHQARELGALEVLPKQLKSSELVEALSRLNFSSDAANDVDSAENTESERHNFEQNKEELEKLVYNAEVALGHESAQQKLQLKLEQQNSSFNKQISSLHAKIDSLIPATEKNSSTQNFWNNLLWGTIYCATVAIFATLYFQQKDKIEQLSENQDQIAETIQSTPLNTGDSLTLREDLDEPSPTLEPSQVDTVPTQTTNRIDNNTRQQLSALEKIVNTNNQIPYDELLLGDTIQANIEELIPSLREMQFTGRVTIVAHDGSFCVNTGNSGEFELAADDAPITQCQITESSARLADIASIGLLQLITASNQSAESEFVITLNPLGTNLPLENYPPIEENTLAGTWNDIALKNRRVDIKFFEER